MKNTIITTQNLKERHDNFVALWPFIYKTNCQQYFTEYSKEEILLHIMLNCEVFYIIDSHTLPQAIEYCGQIFPGTTKDELMQVYDKYLYIVREIYG